MLCVIQTSAEDESRDVNELAVSVQLCIPQGRASSRLNDRFEVNFHDLITTIPMVQSRKLLSGSL